jgi:hypothetical protein
MIFNNINLLALPNRLQSILLLAIIIFLNACATTLENEANQEPTNQLTGQELTYNILNSDNWNNYAFDQQLVLLYYCGDTSEIQTYSQVSSVRNYLSQQTDIVYYEFFTDERSALAPINDTMFFDLTAYLQQDGYLLLKDGNTKQVALHDPEEIILGHFKAFFQP